MLSLILIILTSCVPFVATYITSPQDIFIKEEEEKRKEIFKKAKQNKISFKGKIFVSTIILTTFLAIFQYTQNEKDKIRFESLLANRDSINQKKLTQRDSVSQKLIIQNKNETIEALAKYSLKYDSLQNKVIKLVKDSLKGTVINNAKPDPYFSICPGDDGAIKTELNDSALHFKIKFCSLNSTSKNIILKLSILAVKNNRIVLKNNTNHFECFSKNIRLLKDGTLTCGFSLRLNYKPDNVYILVQGTYTDESSSTIFKIDDMANYDFNLNTFLFPNAIEDSVVRKELNRYP